MVAVGVFVIGLPVLLALVGALHWYRLRRPPVVRAVAKVVPPDPLHHMGNDETRPVHWAPLGRVYRRGQGRTFAVATVLVLTLAGAEPGGCQHESGGGTKKACDTRIVDGPRINHGLVYAKAEAVCDKQPKSHVIELALWRKAGDTFQAQPIATGRVVQYFTLCADAPYPGHNADCEVVVECTGSGGIYEVRADVTGEGPDGGDFAFHVPEQPRAELRCPKR